jgi:DNA-binding IclR family transcriptional regulator
VTDEPHPIHISAEGLERVAALRLSGLPLATFLALLARLDSTGRAEISQPELCELLSTRGGKVWQSLQTLVAAGVIERPVERGGFGRRTPYRIRAEIAVAPSVAPRRRARR